MHRLKEQGASELELNKAVAELKARKKILEAKVRVTHRLDQSAALLRRSKAII